MEILKETTMLIKHCSGISADYEEITISNGDEQLFNVML